MKAIAAQAYGELRAIADVDCARSWIYQPCLGSSPNILIFFTLQVFRILALRNHFDRDHKRLSSIALIQFGGPFNCHVRPSHDSSVIDIAENDTCFASENGELGGIE